MNKLFSLLFIGFLFSCQNNPDPDQSAQSKKLESSNFSDSLSGVLNELYEQGNIIGFSVMVVDQEKAFYEKGFGYSDLRETQSYTVHTIQNIASISKTFLGIALMKAQEMGTLKLDDPVNEYLPFKVTNPYYPEQVITLRHLATHTSSILDSDYYDDKAYILKDEPNESEESLEMYVKFNLPTTHTSMFDYLENVLSVEGEWYEKKGFLKNKPGEAYNYSNVGATLAALVLEMATGMPYDRFTSKYILEPLKMSSTGWSFASVDMLKHTWLYLDKETIIPYYSLITYPDGGLITSAHDLSKYLIELIKGYNGEGVLLNEKSYKEFFTKQLNPENFSELHGENEGIFLSFTSNGFIGHSGGDPGVATHMYFNSTTNIGIILFVNTELDNEGEEQFYSILNKTWEFGQRLNQKPVDK